MAGREYTLEANPTLGNHGQQLWPCSIALAETVAKLDLTTVCEVGCGLGLPGMVAASKGAVVTFVEADWDCARQLVSNIRASNLTANVFNAGWEDATGQYDSIIGSEVTYPSYGIDELAEFIRRCWTGKGPCLLTTSVDYFDGQIERALLNQGFKFDRKVAEAMTPDGRLFIYYVWEVTCRLTF